MRNKLHDSLHDGLAPIHHEVQPLHDFSNILNFGFLFISRSSFILFSCLSGINSSSICIIMCAHCARLWCAHCPAGAKRRIRIFSRTISWSAQLHHELAPIHHEVTVSHLVSCTVCSGNVRATKFYLNKACDPWFGEKERDHALKLFERTHKQLQQQLRPRKLGHQR